jgi:hypothetical protein
MCCRGVPNGARSRNLLFHRLIMVMLPRAAWYHFLRTYADFLSACAPLMMPHSAPRLRFRGHGVDMTANTGSSDDLPAIDWDAIDWDDGDAGECREQPPEPAAHPTSRFVYRRYGDGVPADSIFFFVYGGCPICRREGRDDCFRLVRDPLGTLLDRERWPDHWNHGIARGLVERWTSRQFLLGTLDGTPAKRLSDIGADPTGPDFRPTGGELALFAWQGAWPVPLGRRALARLIGEGWFPPDSAPERLVNLVPFDGDEFGVLILSGTVGQSLVEFFGLGEPMLDAAGVIEGFKPGEAVFRITGFDLAASDLERFTVNARRWWAQFADQQIPVPIGRTPGSTIRDRSYYFTHYRALSQRLGRPARQREFINHLRAGGDTLNRTTLKRNLQGFGLWPWERFVAAARRADNRR